MGVAFDTLVSVTRPDGSELDLAPSLDIQNHSPTGWGWGYAGSGPVQLALALLLDASGDPDVALEHYQDFQVRLRRPLALAGRLDPLPGRGRGLD